MTAEELILRMLRANDYLMREHIRTINDRYAMDPADRSAAYMLMDVVRTGMNFTAEEAMSYVRIVTATI